MKVRIALALLAAAALLVYVGLQTLPRAAAPAASVAPPPGDAARVAPASSVASSAQAFDASPAVRAATARVAQTPMALPEPDAAMSLADAMRDGDARSPPIARDGIVDEPPTVNELADPAAYRRYEARRQARVHRAFEREADIALLGQRRDLERARAQGAPPEILAEGEEKAQKLAQTLRRLREGELEQPQETEAAK